MAKQKHTKLLAVVGVLGVIVLLSGCSDYNPPSSQSQSNKTNVVGDVKNNDNSDASIALKRKACTDEVQNRYREKWNEECHVLKRDDDCTMPPINYLPVEKEKANGMDECYKNYPSNLKFIGEDDFLKELERDKCLNYAEQYYIDTWDKQCKRIGRAKNCTIPVNLSSSYDDMLRGQRDECYMKYPAK